METELTSQRMEFLFLEQVKKVKKYFEMHSIPNLPGLCHLGHFKCKLYVRLLKYFP